MTILSLKVLNTHLNQAQALKLEYFDFGQKSNLVKIFENVSTVDKFVKINVGKTM